MVFSLDEGLWRIEWIRYYCIIVPRRALLVFVPFLNSRNLYKWFSFFSLSKKMSKNLYYKGRWSRRRTNMNYKLPPVLTNRTHRYQVEIELFSIWGLLKLGSSRTIDCRTFSSVHIRNRLLFNIACQSSLRFNHLHSH